MAAELEMIVGFGASGNSLGHLGGGWAQAEADFTWAIGAESHVLIPRAHDDEDYVVTLDVIPFVRPPELPKQRLIVSVNGEVVGSSAINRPTLLGYRIPRELVARSERLLITLQHPDAARPSALTDGADNRLLAFSVRSLSLYRAPAPGRDSRHGQLPVGLLLNGEKGQGGGDRAALAKWSAERTGFDLQTLAIKFESLGENCEFGLVQRQFDAEPLGLMRFSSTFLRNLISGLQSGFEGLGEPDDIDPRLEGDSRKEYMIHEKKYGLIYHTFVYEGQRSVWLMREQEAARLKFLRRKFMEELEVADKIFVYKRNASVAEEEILPLFMALNERGENTLLWVVPADRERPPGTVEVLRPGLLKAYIDRLAPDDNAHDFSVEGWIKVCTNAYVLSRLRRSDS